MKINKKIKIAIATVSGFAFLFFAALIVHIAIMVKGMQPLSDPTVQMARADFKQPVDSSDGTRIENKIRSLRGVKATYFNLKNYILIYTFDNRLNDAQNIYDKAIKNSGFKSVRYTVSQSDLSKGCPVMNGNSFYGKLTAVVSKVVN